MEWKSTGKILRILGTLAIALSLNTAMAFAQDPVTGTFDIKPCHVCAEMDDQLFITLFVSM